jgi:HD-GYP domain-containing protein (c-di-GMP phosphodiesterase class II)
VDEIVVIWNFSTKKFDKIVEDGISRRRSSTRSVKHLEKSGEDEEDDDDSDNDDDSEDSDPEDVTSPNTKRKELRRKYAEKMKKVKKRRTSSGQDEQRYIDCTFIHGTSCGVETLFSTARRVLTDYRKSMSPYMFECLMFLKYNRRYWTAVTFARARAIGSHAAREQADLDDVDLNMQNLDI